MDRVASVWKAGRNSRTRGVSRGSRARSRLRNVLRSSRSMAEGSSDRGKELRRTDPELRR